MFYAQDANTGLRMIRETDWFGRAGSRPPLANDVWAENAWRGYKRGESESSMGFNGTKRTRLTKWASCPRQLVHVLH